MAQRTVRFYQILNSAKERFPNKLPFDDLLDAVAELPDEEAYVSVARMELLGSSYNPSPSGATRAVPLITLDRITRDVSLRIERRRNYRPLVLGDDETLAEPAFYSVFEDNVLAVMRNSGSAPGTASFRDYINKLELIDGGIEVVPLADRNTLRALADIGTLTKFTLAVGPDVNAEVFGTDSSVTGFIRHARQRLGYVAIEVSVAIAPKGQNDAAEIAYHDIESLATSDAIGFVDKAEIRYRRMYDGKSRTYDLLQEAVAQSVDVELDQGKSQPEMMSAARAIAAAYDDLYDDIRSAINSTSTVNSVSLS
ncbi:hypothetical protein E1211_27210 [Micromonospora sp. 15K316]|uniref:hypothetical protein n=1 Tax=Micromonospora sp. 15K316 TaxID=2530376 RepID=UPI00104DF202|nr:hypothetical protein [Micromonospora sp. 15K316]TDC28809.1 hypothetical protein E1211_27210 [Micromonospora sp. 15K316]